MKKCKGCGIEKGFNEFSKCIANKDNLQHECKECKKKKYNLNKTSILQKQLNYYHSNKEIILEKVKQYQNQSHIKEKNKQYLQNYYQENIDSFKEKNQNWIKNNPDYNKQYQNQPHIREKRKEKNKQRRNDPVLGPVNKLHQTISESIRLGFLKIGRKKDKSTLSIIGLESWDLFREYIEKQWECGMSWDNYGVGKDNTTWHIDHIIPKSTATTIEEIKKLNHYTNLRPMWGSDNIKKRNKLCQ